MIGAWVAPPVTILGTLWLARRSEKPRLHVELRRRTPKVIIAGHTQDDISFSITNVGQRLTTVRSVGLVARVGLRRVSYGDSTQPMPSELEPGQSCEISLSWSETLACLLKNSRHVRAAVHTPVRSITVPLDSEVRMLLHVWKQTLDDTPPGLEGESDE